MLCKAIINFMRLRFFIMFVMFKISINIQFLYIIDPRLLTVTPQITAK